MTLKTLTKEVYVCDSCGEELGYRHPCLECGKDYCYECQKKHCIEYKCGVYHSGGKDGVYCLSCDLKLREAKIKDPLHSAYLRIAVLRHQLKLESERFEQEKNKAEKNLEQLREARDQ